MLAASATAILDSLPEDARVLDIGGWACPFNRADHVLDLMPYESRGELGSIGPDAERFSAETWIERDICDREPYPFGDGEIDFVICSHTLEDVRDPIWVCSEMSRIARAGYVEVPSRLEEQIYGIEGPHTGREHHRWLVDVPEPGKLEFTFKQRLELPQNHLPTWVWGRLSPEQRVETVFWEGEIAASERVIYSAHEMDRYLGGIKEQHAELLADPPRRSPTAWLRDRLGRA